MKRRKKQSLPIVAPAQTEIIKIIVQLIIDNSLVETSIKYKIIPGYYEEHYNTKEYLERNLSCFIPFDEDKIPHNAIRTNEEYTSREFAFDTRTGEFVTDKVFFGIDYYNINNKKIEDDNVNRRR